jgi:hypothetical protein
MLAVASGCSEEPALPPIVWEGENLRFGTNADDSTICAGTLPYLDGVVGHLGEVFGRPDARATAGPTAPVALPSSPAVGDQAGPEDARLL